MSDKNEDIINNLFSEVDKNTMENLKDKAKQISQKNDNELINELKKVKEQNNINTEQLETFKQSLESLLSEQQKEKLDKIIELLKDK